MGGAPEVPGARRGCPTTAVTRRCRWRVARDVPHPPSASLAFNGGNPTLLRGLISQTNKVGLSLSPDDAALATASEDRFVGLTSFLDAASDALLMRLTAAVRRLEGCWHRR